jgi:hypothetical protein
MQAEVIEILRRAGDASFVDDLRARAVAEGPTPWPHADDPLLVGLERWGQALAERDMAAAVIALTAAAQYGFPRVMAAGGDELIGAGFAADEESEDGAPVEAQLALAAAQARVEARDDDALFEAFDPSRQLHIWSEDLLPGDDAAFQWYMDVGQCALAALRGLDEGYEPDPDNESYYWWPPACSAGRGLVVAARGLRMPGADLAGIIAALGAAIAAAA